MNINVTRKYTFDYFSKNKIIYDLNETKLRYLFPSGK